MCLIVFHGLVSISMGIAINHSIISSYQPNELMDNQAKAPRIL